MSSMALVFFLEARAAKPPEELLRTAKKGIRLLPGRKPLLRCQKTTKNRLKEAQNKSMF
jgi:hypothetical protein